MSQNYPNPFNPGTTIAFDLTEGSDVNLTIFNMTGQKVDTITDDFFPAGQHQIEFNGKNLASGVYIYILKTAGFQEARKMILMR